MLRFQSETRTGSYGCHKLGSSMDHLATNFPVSRSIFLSSLKSQNPNLKSLYSRFVSSPTFRFISITYLGFAYYFMFFWSFDFGFTIILIQLILLDEILQLFFGNLEVRAWTCLSVWWFNQKLFVLMKSLIKIAALRRCYIAEAIKGDVDFLLKGVGDQAVAKEVKQILEMVFSTLILHWESSIFIFSKGLFVY